TFEVVRVPPCTGCGAELDPLTAMEGQGRCAGCASAPPRRERVALAAPPAVAVPPPPPSPPPPPPSPPRPLPPPPAPVEASRKGKRQKLTRALQRSAEFVSRGLLRRPAAAGAPPRAPRQVVHLVAATAG